MTVKAVLFDIDGVLIRLERHFSETPEMAAFPDHARVMDEFYGSDVNRDCDRGRLDPRIEIAPYLRRIGWTGSSREYLEAQYEYEAKYIDRGLLERIPKLADRGIRKYIASNQNRYRMAFLKTALNIAVLFDGAFFSCELDCGKPESRYWELVLERLRNDVPGIADEHILFLDDLPKNVESAEAFGIRTILVRGNSDIDRAFNLIAAADRQRTAR